MCPGMSSDHGFRAAGREPHAVEGEPLVHASKNHFFRDDDEFFGTSRAAV